MAEATAAATEADDGRLSPLADRLGMTEGQLYTLIIGVVLSLTTAFIGFPALRGQDSALAASGGSPPPISLAPSAAQPDPTTTTTVPGTSPPVPTTSRRPAITQPPSTSGGGATTTTTTSGPASTTTTTTTGAPQEIVGARGESFAIAGSPGAGAPWGVVADADGGFWVTTDNTSGAAAVARFGPDGRPDRSISVALNGDDRAGGLAGLAFTATGDLLVAAASPAEIRRVNLATGSVSTYAAIPNLPACVGVIVGPSVCERGITDNAPLPRGIAFRADGSLLVADAAQRVVWLVAPKGQSVELFAQDNDWGDLTGGGGPVGVAVASTGVALVSVERRQSNGSGALYAIQGSEISAVFDAADGAPAGLAISSAGSVMMALREADAIVVLSPAFEEVARWPTLGPAVTRPLGVAFRTTSLLVASGDGGIMRIAAGERGAQLNRG